MRFAALIAVGLGGAFSAEAGTLKLTVQDGNGGLPLAGAAVRLSGPRSVDAITGADGTVTIELEAGTWIVEASFAGFAGVTVEGLRIPEVGLVTQVLSLSGPEVAECVVVESKRPALTKQFLQRIPAGRQYQSAVQATPGGVVGGVEGGVVGGVLGGVAAGSGGNPNMGGSANVDSGWTLDGSNVTGAYDHPGHGPLVMADQDRLSTFAIDVDTASYAMTRRMLREGVMPDPASVRVEEFVNAFRYDYPASDDPIGLHLEASPHPTRGDRVLLSVALDTQRAAIEARPVRLTFLVDVSGSMSSPDKLPLAKHALHRLIDGLGPEDRVSLVTYAGQTGIALKPSWTVDKEPIHRAIDGLGAGGGTAMGAGIDLAYRMAADMNVPGAENRVVILTDGDANVGQNSVEALLGKVTRYAGEGIGLSVVGFGQGNYKDALLERLADQGDGNYHYVDDPREADEVFGRDLAANLVTLARDVKVQVEFPTESVLAWRQLGYENRAVADEDFRDDTVDGGEIGPGHQVTALYELVLRDHPKGDLARVHLRAEPPGPERPAVETHAALAADRLGDPSRAMRWAAAVSTFAEVLRRSPHVAETTFGDVLALVDAARDPDDPEHTELRELVVRAAQLSGGFGVAMVPAPVPTREPGRSRPGLGVSGAGWQGLK